MFCYVMPKYIYDLSYDKRFNIDEKAVCIGDIISINTAEQIAEIFPCLTEVVILGEEIKSCFILCG